MSPRPAHAALPLLLAVIACDEPTPPPPAIVGEDDAFAAGYLRALAATDDDLYFYYSATDLAGPVPGPEAGVYRVPVEGGAPVRVLETASLRGAERSGDQLVMVTHGAAGARLVTLPLDGGEATSVPVAADSVAATSSGGATFVLAAEDTAGGMSITRLATETEPEQVFAVRERAFVVGAWFHALDGALYWLEGADSDLARLADDQSQAEPEVLPTILDGIPATGQVEDERHRLLGTVGDELYATVFLESFFPDGDTLDNGDPSGDYGFGGGAIYAASAGSDELRVVAVDVVQAVIAGETIFGQDRDGDLVEIDPATGATTKLAGRAPLFGMFVRPVVNDELLFYADDDYGGPHAIRYVSLAPRDP